MKKRYSMIVPIAMEQYGNNFYFNIGENYTISKDSNKSADELNQELYIDYYSTYHQKSFNIQNHYKVNFKGYTHLLSSTYYNEDGIHFIKNNTDLGHYTYFFLYDGAGMFFFPEETTLKINDKEYKKLGPKSYVKLVGGVTLIYYDTESGTAEAIELDYDKVTPDNVVEIMQKALTIHAQNRKDCEYLIKYFLGDQDILYRQASYTSDINNKTVVNYAFPITRQIVGYTYAGGVELVQKDMNKKGNRKKITIGDALTSTACLFYLISFC